MRPIAGKARTTLLGALAALAVFIPAAASAASHPSAASRPSAASAVKLRGGWAPFTRCPVDSKAMLAADGVNHIAVCVASSSPTGSLTIGSQTLAAGASNLQFGLVGSYASGFSIVSPAGGAISAAPVNVPGGLLGIVCPTNNPLLALLCSMLVNSPLNAVTATIQQAGAPSNFNFTAGITAGKPIVTIPVKIHLSNPLLGPSCYIGTNANPIVLRPKNKTTPNVRGDSFNANGTPNPSGVMSGIFSTGGTQEDTSFAVPGASGCTLLGLGLPINFLVNQKEGLPSPAGHNSLVLSRASAYLAGLSDPVSAAPNDGKDLSRYWHSAVLP
ncbi:MAG: hypothetical protein JOY82_17155 [Streptosporangiaceae bacterium]|nr:hypothetical protein [Streptosporangiaceae bacterium]MBV9856221.1 hypothetical protein [Streptosporangiaceae bacterium]